MLRLAISGAFKSLAFYIKSNSEMKRHLQERQLNMKEQILSSKLDLIKNGANADSLMDTERKHSWWMDDLSFIILLMPLVLAFIPSMSCYVQAGFEAIASMPEWYKYSVAMMLISVWGWRRVLTPILEKILMSRYGKSNTKFFEFSEETQDAINKSTKK